MMPTLPVADCARLLGIHPKTLHHWLAQANVPLVAHPTDARIKCVTEEHLQLVARLHGRPLLSAASSRPLDAVTAPLVPSQEIVGPLQINEVQPASMACVLPSPSTPEADLIQKLSSLETKIVTLQEQLAQLALALLQERERSVEHRLTTRETTIAELVKKSVLPTSLPNSQATGVGPERVYAWHSPQQLNPAEQDTRSRLPALIEYSAQGTSVIISSQQGELHLAPDSAEWFAWFATISSFRFVGQQGRFTAYRHSRSSRSWRAHRCIHQRTYKQTLGVTDHLTIRRLEQVAATLQSHMASLSFAELRHVPVFLPSKTSATVVWMASRRPNGVNTWARMATSPNHEGVVGTDSGAIWTFTQGCVILVLCPPYWAIDVFPPSKETQFCLFYQDFTFLSLIRSMLIACCYLVAHIVGHSRSMGLHPPRPRSLEHEPRLEARASASSSGANASTLPRRATYALGPAVSTNTPGAHSERFLPGSASKTAPTLTSRDTSPGRFRSFSSIATLPRRNRAITPSISTYILLIVGADCKPTGSL